MFSKHRLEALSDGIFAIVMTLLVLDLKFPDGPLPKHFAIHFAGQCVSFVITFIIAAIFWTLQHRIFALVEDIHMKTLVPTFVFLGLISVLPFSTALLGQHVDQHYPFIVYYTHALFIALALTLKLLMLGRVKPPSDPVEYELLKLRLFIMCFIMGVLAVASIFLRGAALGMAAGAGALASRFLTRGKKARLEAMRVQPSA